MELQLSKNKKAQALQSLTTTSPREVEARVLSSLESILNYKDDKEELYRLRKWQIMTRTNRSIDENLAYALNELDR